MQRVHARLQGGALIRVHRGMGHASAAHHRVSHRARDTRGDYARFPVNGKLPIMPMPISPDMASPATLPVKASVSGIGLVMETFQATSSPATLPSKISVELPSAPCVPVSVPPELFRFSVALRSPIGVLIVRFQFPSTAIRPSSLRKKPRAA